ncbi:MAG: tetratricopeptide repeat protein [Oligoflexia bacterium]|nr:tetratricopeptide repeat protein [Oligoflexia bacterium]
MDPQRTYAKGNEAFANCNYETALRYYLSIFERYEADENLLLRISQCYQELDLFDESIEFLERLLDINIKQKNYKKAVAVCKRILSIDPDDTEVVLKLANILRLINQPVDAARYYRIAARHYEYAGFLEKAVDILQIVKELEQTDVDDMLELVKKEYERGAKASADKNIHAIIYELKKGREYELLDVALNLALTHSPYNLANLIELADLCFYSGKLWKCMRLCLWGLNLNPESFEVWSLLIRSLLASGHERLAREITESMAAGRIDVDSDNAKLWARSVYDFIGDLEFNKVQPLKDNGEPVSDEEIDLSYLGNEDFTRVMHADIDKEVLNQELKGIIDSAYNEKTVIMDHKRKTKLPPHLMDLIREAEILVAEGLYDKAGSILLKVFDEDPGNEVVKSLLDKVMELDHGSEYSGIYSAMDGDLLTTDEIIADLERAVGEGDDNERMSSENVRLERQIRQFSDIVDGKFKPGDYQTVFELGIAYMELELWEEAKNTFANVISYLSDRGNKAPKFIESNVYYAYCIAQLGSFLEAVDILRGILNNKIDRAHSLEVLYYLGICYEKAGNIKDAREVYKDIQALNPEYRDVEIRADLIRDR